DVVIVVLFDFATENNKAEPSDLLRHVVRRLMEVVSPKVFVIFAFPDHLSGVISLANHFPEPRTRPVGGDPVADDSPRDFPSPRLKVRQPREKAQADNATYNVFKFGGMVATTRQGL